MNSCSITITIISQHRESVKYYYYDVLNINKYCTVVSLSISIVKYSAVVSVHFILRDTSKVLPLSLITLKYSCIH